MAAGQALDDGVRDAVVAPVRNAALGGGFRISKMHNLKHQAFDDEAGDAVAASAMHAPYGCSSGFE